MKNSLLRSAAPFIAPPPRQGVTIRYPLEIYKDGDRWLCDIPAALTDPEGKYIDGDTLTVRLDHLPAIMARR